MKIEFEELGVERWSDGFVFWVVVGFEVWVFECLFDCDSFFWVECLKEDRMSIIEMNWMSMFGESLLRSW